MKNFHSEKELECVECDITYDRETQLKKHNLVKHSTGSKPQCSICQKSFLTKINLANHIRYAHKQNEESKCEQCGKIFSNKITLKLHMTNVHSPKEFYCNICQNTCQARAIWTHTMNRSIKKIALGSVKLAKKNSATRKI